MTPKSYREIQFPEPIELKPGWYVIGLEPPYIEPAADRAEAFRRCEEANRSPVMIDKPVTATRVFDANQWPITEKTHFLGYLPLHTGAP